MATHPTAKGERLLARLDAFLARLGSFEEALHAESCKTDPERFAPWFRKTLTEASRAQSVLSPREQIQCLADDEDAEAVIRRNAVRTYLHASPQELEAPALSAPQDAAQPPSAEILPEATPCREPAPLPEPPSRKLRPESIAQDFEPDPAQALGFS